MALILSGDTGPSFVQAAAMPSGSVIQTVNATFVDPATVTSTTSTPASSVLTISITPKFSTSKIVILTNTQVLNGGFPSHGAVAIYRNGTTSLGWNSYGYGSASNNWFPATNVSYDSPATTSATTYTLYYARTSGSGSFQLFWGSGASSTITAMEIAG